MSVSAHEKMHLPHPHFIPWEARWEEPGGFLKSWVLLMTQPREFYRRMAFRGGAAEPFTFGMLCTAFAFAVTVLQVLIAYFLFKDRAWISWFPGADRTQAFVFNMACVFVVLTPAFALYAMLWTLVGAVVARLIGGPGERGAGLEAYFSLSAYATGPALLALVPGLGWVVGAVWGLVLAVLGLRTALRLDLAHTVLALVVPLVVVGLLNVLLYLLF